jgi:hypothetical protein
MALLQKAYLGATPLFRNEDWFEDGAANIVNTSGSTTLTANSSAHTKGNYTQLIASTSADASFLVVALDNFNTASTNTASLLDIATGASGSETNIATNVAVGGAGQAINTYSALSVLVGFPIKIPSGTRLSARIQSVVTGGKTGRAIAFLIDAGDYATAPTSVDVIGTDAATSKGTEFSGSSGTWVEAIASTAQSYRAVALVCSLHDSDSANNTSLVFDVGIGASGSEVAFGQARFAINSNEVVSNLAPFSYLFGRSIPAGSRLAVKHPFTSSPSKYGFCLIGIP